MAPIPVKFGGYFFHLDFEPVNANNARGLFDFTGRYTGNALGDFLLGAPNQGRWDGRTRSVAGPDQLDPHLH